jgi:hypothetical protein
MTKSTMGKKHCYFLSWLLIVFVIAFFLSTQAKAAAKTCPPRPQNTLWALTVLASGSAGAGGGQLDKDEFLACWQPVPRLNGQKHFSSTGGGGQISADYSYDIGMGNFSISATTSGHGTPQRANASAGADVLVEWLDQLTFHSNKIKPIQRGPDGKPIITKDSFYSVTIKVNGAPTCSASGSSKAMGLWSFIAEDEKSSSELKYAPIKDSLYSFRPSAEAQAMLCGGAYYGKISGTQIDLLNDSVVSIRGQASVGLNEVLDSGNSSGNSKGGWSGMSICVVRPAQPDDVTLTSLSGTNYWCSN